LKFIIIFYFCNAGERKIFEQEGYNHLYRISGGGGKGKR